MWSAHNDAIGATTSRPSAGAGEIIFWGGQREIGERIQDELFLVVGFFSWTHADLTLISSFFCDCEETARKSGRCCGATEPPK